MFIIDYLLCFTSGWTVCCVWGFNTRAVEFHDDLSNGRTFGRNRETLCHFSILYGPDPVHCNIATSKIIIINFYTMWIVFITAKYIFGCYNWVICWSEESLKRKDFIIIIVFQPKAATNKTIHSECTSCTGDLFCKGKQLFWVCSCILHVLIVSKMIELWMKWC